MRKENNLELEKLYNKPTIESLSCAKKILVVRRADGKIVYKKKCDEKDLQLIRETTSWMTPAAAGQRGSERRIEGPTNSRGDSEDREAWSKPEWLVKQ